MLKPTARASALIGNFRKRGAVSACSRSSKAYSSLALASQVDLSESTTTTKTVGDSYTERVRNQKYDDLLNSVNRERPNPSRAWGYYIDLLDFLKLEQLPLELHQLVLRKCVPPTSELRLATVRRTRTGASLKRPHYHESRLRAVISNIRAAGWKPSLDDYHFILSQFAAVGHHVGAGRVLQEMIKMGIEPQTKTFGLCLQAIAHRLCLPCPHWMKERVLDECVQLSMSIVDGIRDSGAPTSPVNLDLAMRIIKEVGRSEAFEALLRSGYGIDLSFPDHHPLSSMQEGEPSSNAASPKGSVNPQLLTTTMLTTIVDFYGRHNQISRMIQLFEVLSNPLPVLSNRTGTPSIDEDDEDDFPVIDESTRTRPLPSAVPNITTFNTIIRHCASLNHELLAQHYLMLAIHMDEIQAAEIRSLLTQRSSDITPPKVLVNRESFLPLVGFANTNKDRMLMKWLMSLNRKLYRRKKADLANAIAALKEESGVEYSDIEYDYEGPRDSDKEFDNAMERYQLRDDNTLRRNGFFTSTPPPEPLAQNFDVHPLDMEIDSGEPPAQTDATSKEECRTFDLLLHIKLLHRDIKNLTYLDTVMGRSLVRICDRRKESLGRRVWGEKDIYLDEIPKDLAERRRGGDTSGARVLVERDRWKRIVNFGGRQKRIRNSDTQSSIGVNAGQQDAPMSSKAPTSHEGS